MIMDAEEAYKEARRIMKRRFGDEYTICQAFINKVRNYPTVTESGLRKYADIKWSNENSNTSMSWKPAKPV